MISKKLRKSGSGEQQQLHGVTMWIEDDTHLQHLTILRYILNKLTITKTKDLSTALQYIIIKHKQLVLTEYIGQIHKITNNLFFIYSTKYTLNIRSI